MPETRRNLSASKRPRGSPEGITLTRILALQDPSRRDARRAHPQSLESPRLSPPTRADPNLPPPRKPGLSRIRGPGVREPQRCAPRVSHEDPPPRHGESGRAHRGKPHRAPSQLFPSACLRDCPTVPSSTALGSPVFPHCYQWPHARGVPQPICAYLTCGEGSTTVGASMSAERLRRIPTFPVEIAGIPPIPRIPTWKVDKAGGTVLRSSVLRNKQATSVPPDKQASGLDKQCEVCDTPSMQTNRPGG